MLKLTIKTPKGRHWRCSGVFIVNFEHILHLVLVFLPLTLSRKMSAGTQLISSTMPHNLAAIIISHPIIAPPI